MQTTNSVGVVKTCDAATESCEIKTAANADAVVALKGIKASMPAPQPHWVGDGFFVFPVFSNLAFSAHLSPFLMFDYGAPKFFPPTAKRLGVGRHPHRGMETVTIAFQGEVEHSDNTGNTGIIGPGDVQWMTAGRGIVHAEYHSRKMAAKGGTIEMCQLWVNLPRKHKMTAPRYQPIRSADIPIVQLPSLAGGDKAHGQARVIAGVFRGTRGPAITWSPITLIDLSLRTPHRLFELDTPPGHQTLLFVRRGAIEIMRTQADGGGEHAGTYPREKVGPQGMVRLELAGVRIKLQATEANTQVLWMGGEPIDEPIAARGPFVMNTQAELRQAMDDYRQGRF